MRKSSFAYLSSDQKTQIHACMWAPEEDPVAVVQIAHGMVEFIDRYDAFARFLCGHRFLVVGNDHLGHGQSVLSRQDWGYFADQDPQRCVLEDLHALTLRIKADYPGLPYVLFGHSMGSFFARVYLCEYGRELSGAIICGTGQQPLALVRAGNALTGVIAAFKGWHHRSKLVDQLAFGGMNKPFEPGRTPKDWLTRDEGEVDAYLADDRCTFLFTLNAYRGMFQAIAAGRKPSMIARIPKDLPVLYVAGGDDPVGGRGAGVQKAAQQYTDAGMRAVQCILYPGMRHEILNEIDRTTVYHDILQWLVNSVQSCEQQTDKMSSSNECTAV